ncbi:2-deoxy-D-gluconate 3-dehydrogenase [Falsochrobactrum shanghaiense]|uniref:2-deoxy-D-gluconate 3-dehydrogenase n=1 Tax=Falsochrobactrum shanghaiense TaxID=2201899 RepID=A0A316JD61_9HYPH|nr:SDR family oxidoreductase [Falsochrobactrum shanghaiense]PWL18605.1 2-deoxy-D-gluconate 3-dehydrogenase [Falsochrobactrum shanghaiense]
MTFQSDIFAGKTALVTGATTGIGAGVAQGLARLGANVTAVGLGADQARAQDGSAISFRELDVCDEAGVQALVDSLDRIDIVVNCAGVIRRHEEHQLDVFEKVLAINLTGTMRVSTAARAKLAESKGAIVNTASMLSFFGGGLVPAYSASKGGVAQLTKSLAIAYAPDGIRVNAVAPGWIATLLTQALQDDPARSGPILERTPMKRWGKPEDIAGAVAFLCSPAAAFITGIVMPVDGGYLVS